VAPGRPHAGVAGSLRAGRYDNCALGHVDHVVVGTSQPTAASATLVNDRYEASVLLGANDIGGDGTVSAASLPKGTPLDSNSIRRIADKHANLQCNTAALDEVESIIRSEPMNDGKGSKHL
jgi:hypothetical protein